MALTKAKLEVYRLVFVMGLEACNKVMQFVLAAFAMYWFGRSMEKFIMTDTPLDAKKWGAAMATFAAMIFAVYAYFFKSEKKDEKKEPGKVDKIVDAFINKMSNGTPPNTPPSTTP